MKGKRRRRFTALTLGVWGVILLAGVTLTIINLVFNRVPDTAKAATFNGVTIDKKYVSSGSEVTNISVGSGASVKVRLKYNTVNTASSTNVNIADTLPSGFTYVPGSIKNCYVDTTCVTLSDSLVSGSNISVAPGAGYFGYATTATTSNLELGRKRYVTQQDCRYNYNVGGDIDNYYTWRIQFVSSSSNTATCPGAPNGSYTTQNASTIQYDLTGFRYLAQTICQYSKAGDDVYALFGLMAFQNSSTAASNCATVGDYTTITNTPVVRDMLGVRYLHQRVCEYTTSSGNVDKRGLYDVTGANNTANSTANCNTISGYTTNTSTALDYDMSDTTRGYGYIEYDMLAPSLAGSYGTSVSMTGSFNVSALTQNAANTITVSHGATIDKKYISNGSEVDSVKVPPSGRVTVRLKYNNTDVGSHTGVNITDSLPSGFTYVPGTIKNCYVDASCVTLNDALFSGSNLSVAPAAGYFGYANNITSSNLEPGRYKNLILHSCFYYSIGGDYFVSQSPAFSGSGFNFAAPTKFSNSNTDSSTCSSSGSSTYTFNGDNTPVTLPLTGSRYLHLSNCIYVNFGSGDFFFITGNGPSDTYFTSNSGFDNNASGSLSCGAGNGSWTWSNSGQAGFVSDLDILGMRYMHLHTCYFVGSESLASMANSTDGYDAPTKFSQFAPDTNTGCAGNGNYTLSSRYLNTFDMSDTSRGYGYIEYDMDATETQGTYGTNVAMSGSFSGTALTATKTNSITVGYTPVASLTKEYSLDGTNWFNSVSARRGQAVYVRLKYNNTGDGPATNVRLTDTIPTGASLISGTVTNTMADGAAVSLPDSVFTGGTSLSVSPSAGLFGNGTTDTSGNLVPGRKKYFSISQCAFYFQSSDIVSGARFNNGPGVYGPISNPNFSNTVISDTTCYHDDFNWTARGGTNIANVDITGKRYVSIGQCATYFNSTGNYEGGMIFYNGDSNDGPNYSPFAGNSLYTSGGCTTGGGVWYSWSGLNSINFDVINNRYLHIAECYYYISGDVLGGFIANAGGYGPNYDPYTDNNPTSNSNSCNYISGATDYLSVQNADLDMQDTSRGYGYIQYTMLMDSNIASGNYGTTATLADTDAVKEFTDKTAGNSTDISIANLSATISKQYSTDGITFLNSVTAKRGQTVWVRLNYNNTDVVSATNTRITDSIPDNFSLVSGSVKNSYVDAASVALPDSVFSGSNLTTAPGAGYFGYATTVTTSNLEMGKKKNLYYSECVYIPRAANSYSIGGVNGQNFSFNYDPYGTSYGGFATNPDVGNSDTSPNTCGGGDDNWWLESGSPNVVSNMTGKKNFIMQDCLIYDTTGGYRIYGSNDNLVFNTAYGDSNPTSTNRFSFDPFFSDNTTAGYGCSAYGAWAYSGINNEVYTSVLGKRYLNLAEGVYRRRNVPEDSVAVHTPFVVTGTAPEGNTGFCPNPSATDIPVTITCGNGDANWYRDLGYNKFTNLDLLDTSRGYGYLEYQMIAGNSATSTTYNPTATLLDTDANPEFTSVTSSPSLTISPSPTVTFTKQYSTDGTNFSNTLNTSAGQTVWVRLNYNNTGDVSADNVRISDSLPSNFSLVSGSVRNSYADATAVSLPDTVFSGSSLTTSPGAGYFGYTTSTTASNWEMGRKKYIKNPQCMYFRTLSNPNTLYLYTVNQEVIAPITLTSYPGTYGMDPSAINTSDTSISCGSGNAEYPNQVGINSSARVTDITGYRYVKYTQCVYWNDVSNNSTFTENINAVGGYGVDPVATNTLDNMINCPNTDNNLQYYNGVQGGGDNLGAASIDLLGNRYAKYTTCTYHYQYSTNLDLIRLSINQRTSSSLYGDNPVAGNNLSSTANCPSGTTDWTLQRYYSNAKIIDLLDNTRGYGFIEYKMTSSSSTPTGTYGTTANIKDMDTVTDFSQINSGSSTDITIIPTIVTSGLQLYYDATNPSSYPGTGQTVTDLSGNSNDTTLGKTTTVNSNDPGFNSTSPKRFTFQSSSDQFLETSLNSGFSSSFSAEFWMERGDNTDTAGSSVRQRLFTKFNSGQTSTAIALGIQGTTIQALANGNTYNSTFIPNTLWQHVVLTYDSTTSTGKIYVNSALQTTFTQALAANSSPGAVKIGIFDETQATQSDRRGFNGDISKVRIYNRALSSTEVSNNFSSESGNYGFSGSSLSVTVPSGAAFTDRSVTSNSQTSSATVGNIVYTDRRASFVPWSSSITMSNCTTTGGVIPANNLSITPGSLSTTTGSGLNNSAGTSGSFADATTARTLVSNSAGNGGGTFIINPTLSITIPSFSKAGIYSCTATISTA